jgi:hypothetical protein
MCLIAGMGSDASLLEDGCKRIRDVAYSRKLPLMSGIIFNDGREEKCGKIDCEVNDGNQEHQLNFYRVPCDIHLAAGCNLKK